MSTDNVGDSATAASEGINPDLTSTAGFEDLDAPTAQPNQQLVPKAPE